MTRLSAQEYRDRYGATTGDRVRLGDTVLWIRVGEDRTAPGDEPIWGYAKNLRMRMTQDDSAAGPSVLDVLLAGALVVDLVLGVVKADIGIKGVASPSTAPTTPSHAEQDRAIRAYLRWHNRNARPAKPWRIKAEVHHSLPGVAA